MILESWFGYNLNAIFDNVILNIITNYQITQVGYKLVDGFQF